MFGIGLPELLLILVLALIVFGPDKLPQLARQLASFLGKLKKASEEFKGQLDLNETLKDVENPRPSDKTATSQESQRPEKKKDTKSSPDSEEKKRN